MDSSNPSRRSFLKVVGVGAGASALGVSGDASAVAGRENLGASLMRYNTGNPVEPDGSSDPRDLYDNASNLDLLLNGPLGEYLGRLGVPLRSWRGIMQQVTDYLIASNYESVYLAYGAGVIVQRQTQLVQRNGELYRVLDQATLPLTLIGNWTVDAPKLLAVGDQALRQLLASSAGAGQSGYLLSETYPENTVGAELQAITDHTAKTGMYPGQHFAAVNGGQLNKLRQALTDPFMQYLGIVLFGDSITWGMTANGMAAIEPRASALTDARNNSTSNSWANLFHKWLGSEFYDTTTFDAHPWPGSPSGLAQFIYTKPIDLFPGYAPFVNVGSFAQLADTSTTLGYFWNVNMNVSGGGPHSFSWTMTGDSFDLIYSATDTGAEYTVHVDGVLQGTYKTSAIDQGIPTGYRYSRTHSFTFKRGAVVKVTAVGGNSSRASLRIEAIRLQRKVRVTNQGIIGIASGRYSTTIMADAMRANDSFCMIQLGTNDRAIPASTGLATVSSVLTKNIGVILDGVQAAGLTPILMCANEVTDNAPPAQHFTMGEVRASLSSLARDRKVDFIDHFALTQRLVAQGVSYLVGTTHPNDLGHFLMFENIRNAMGNPVYIADPAPAPPVDYYETTVAWTAGAAQTITHNLGAVPVRVEFEAVMKVAAAELAIGETAMVTPSLQATASYNAMARKLTATTLQVVVAPQGLAVLTTTGSAPLTAAQANLKVKVSRRVT